jgi:hypothetical protein
VSVTWSGTQWGLTSGDQTIPVLLGPVKYGTNLYGVEGVYTVQGTGEQIDAGLLFRFDGSAPVLQTIYGFPKGTKQEAQPYEIKPTAGDAFTAQIRTYTVSGGQLRPGVVQGDTLTFGGDTPSLTRLPAPSGGYVAGLLVRDISGRFSYQYQDITVDNSGAGPNAPLNPTPAPSSGGAQVYQSAELRFRLEYPQGWETLDTGNSQIYVYDPASSGQVFISVDVYSLNESAAQSNRQLLDSFIESVEKQADGQRGDEREVTLAGLEGPSIAYSYTSEEGVRYSGVAIVVTSPNTGLSYLLSVQAPEDEFQGRTETFDAILSSLVID